MPSSPDPPAGTRLDHDSAEQPGLAEDALDVEGLKLRGDVKGLLDLAKAYRSGSAPGGRDLKRCFDVYVAAAEIGSAEAEYAVALFWMSGGVVERDQKEGAMRLRAAADKGSLPAKVYLGNLYELGIHYKADPEKADVWYRNAARAANVTAEPGSPEHARELAELGCARYVRELVEGGSLDEDDRTRLLQRARAHGYAPRAKDDSAPASEEAPSAPESTAEAVPVAKKAAKAPRETNAKSAKGAADKTDKPNEKARASSGAFAAFGYALLFVIAGVAAGYAGTLGARELVAHGHALPGIGTRVELVFPILLGAIGVLPSCLVYRFGTMLHALVVGAFLGGVGWVAWGTGQAAIHASRPAQTIAFGLAGFLAALFVLGLRGRGAGGSGVKRRN